MSLWLYGFEALDLRRCPRPLLITSVFIGMVPPFGVWSRREVRCWTFALYIARAVRKPCPDR